MFNKYDLYISNTSVVSSKIVAPFRGMHVSPAKHSFGKCDRKVWRMDGRTDRQTDGQSDPNVSLCFAGDTIIFIRPSSDGTYYGMVMSVRPSGSPSVRHSFPHFSPTCFDILIWNCVYHFIFMHVRSSSNAINFRHFLQELCSFLTSNSYKYAVFRTFLLHALTYWVQILYMILF